MKTIMCFFSNMSVAGVSERLWEMDCIKQMRIGQKELLWKVWCDLVTRLVYIIIVKLCIKAPAYSLVQWNWFSDITGCTGVHMCPVTSENQFHCTRLHMQFCNFLAASAPTRGRHTPVSCNVHKPVKAVWYTWKHNIEKVTSMFVNNFHKILFATVADVRNNYLNAQSISHAKSGRI